MTRVAHGRDRAARTSAGFTLLELVVAVAIFAVLSTLAYGGLRTVTETDRELEARERHFARVQTAVAIIQQDLGRLVARGVRDELGDPIPALRGGLAGVVLELTRGGVIGDPGAPVDLRRVDYAFAGGALERRVWEVLDRTQASTYRSRVLLEDLERVALRFFESGWLEFWPPAGNRQGLAALPSGIELELDFADGTRLRRVFRIHARG